MHVMCVAFGVAVSSQFCIDSGTILPTLLVIAEFPTLTFPVLLLFGQRLIEVAMGAATIN